METNIIGIDAATQPKKVGLARASKGERHAASVDLARPGAAREDIAATVAEWIEAKVRAGERVLLAIDAPLGWPVPLRSALTTHRAGEPASIPGCEMFRRRTDHRIKESLKKNPFAVGADKIAWTAHWALRFLAEIGERLHAPVPLAWSPDFEGVAAIEVYPAATARAHGIDTKQRTELQGRFEGHGIRFPPEFDLCDQTAHVRDAILCVLAGCDFLSGAAEPPGEDAELAKTEGWIWVKRPEA